MSDKNEIPVNPEENEQPENAVGQEETGNGDEKDKQIAELKEQVAALNDKHLRLYSEFDNFRKRTAKERIEMIQTAGGDVIKSLLPVLDDLDRAVKSNETAADIASVKEGVQLVAHKFHHTLNQKGLVPIEAIGKPFDVDQHEAITEIPAPSPELKGKVVEEIEKGYMLGGKVLRFAKVIVGS